MYCEDPPEPYPPYPEYPPYIDPIPYPEPFPEPYPEYPEYEDEVKTVAPKNRFSDVDISSDVGEAANVLAGKGVIGGYADGEFKADKLVNRAEAAKFILLARFGQVPEGWNGGRFWDVLDGEWYVKYVIYAADKGIIRGHPDGSFRPADSVNTAELLKMLTVAFGYPQDMQHGYADVPADAWFDTYAGLAERFELFPGRGTYLDPSSPLTRGEVALAIHRLMGQEL
jgi:hypothetical protein